MQAILSLRLTWSNTAFQDEGLYLRAGHLEWTRWLHQAAIPDFPSYFSGAPVIYPPLGAVADSLGGLAAARVANNFLASNAPSTFKLIVNPLVTWMWIGGLIALLGALTALWPSRGRRRGAPIRTEADALKEAKYREIRDAELDHASGKLSDADFALLDAELRREAVAILDRVENGNGSARRAENGGGAGEKREKAPQG